MLLENGADHFLAHPREGSNLTIARRNVAKGVGGAEDIEIILREHGATE